MFHELLIPCLLLPHIEYIQGDMTYQAGGKVYSLIFSCSQYSGQWRCTNGAAYQRMNDRYTLGCQFQGVAGVNATDAAYQCIQNGCNSFTDDGKMSPFLTNYPLGGSITYSLIQRTPSLPIVSNTNLSCTCKCHFTPHFLIKF